MPLCDNSTLRLTNSKQIATIPYVLYNIDLVNSNRLRLCIMKNFSCSKTITPSFTLLRNFALSFQLLGLPDFQKFLLLVNRHIVSSLLSHTAALGSCAPWTSITACLGCTFPSLLFFLSAVLYIRHSLLFIWYLSTAIVSPFLLKLHSIQDSSVGLFIQFTRRTFTGPTYPQTWLTITKFEYRMVPDSLTTT